MDIFEEFMEERQDLNEWFCSSHKHVLHIRDTKKRYLGEVFKDINCNPIAVRWNTIFLRVCLCVDLDLLDKLFASFIQLHVEICGLKYKSS